VLTDCCGLYVFSPIGLSYLRYSLP